MGLTVKLSWYDKQTEFIVEDETSEDFGNDCTIVETLGLSIKKMSITVALMWGVNGSQRYSPCLSTA